MPRIIKLITAILLLIALAGCGALPSSAPAPTAQPMAAATCDPVESIHDSPDKAGSLRSALEADHFEVLRIQASVHTLDCEGLATQQPESQTITSIDLAIDVAQDDLSEWGLIGESTRMILNAIEDVEPNLPGQVDLRFVQSGSALALSFTRDQAREAIQARRKNVDLLAALGFPPVATGSGPCTVVWGKQPLPALTQTLRGDFEKHGLAIITEVSAVKVGQWCGSDFSVRQTEFHVGLGWLDMDKDQVKSVYGERLATTFDILLALPKDQILGDLTPRISILFGWANGEAYLTTTLDEARSLREAGLSGTVLIDKFDWKVPY